MRQPQQQISQIEKSVTHLLVATKQLLETLTDWSRGVATEGKVSDVYVRLGYEFNIACRAFNAIGVDTGDLGPVPDLLRAILEETLSQEASQASLDQFLPRIRDIIIHLLHGLKKKQQRLRQRSGREGYTVNGEKSGSFGSSISEQGQSTRQSNGKPQQVRQVSAEQSQSEGPRLPPRGSSVPGRVSPTKYENQVTSPKSFLQDGGQTPESSLSPSSPEAKGMVQFPYNTMPYPQEDRMPTAQSVQPATSFQPTNARHPPIPIPPSPKQQDAFASLQKAGELERRASRRFSAYQIQKHLGASPHGIPMLPAPQYSPLPNRGRDVRESLHAVRTRTSQQISQPRGAQRHYIESSPPRSQGSFPRKISEERTDIPPTPTLHPPTDEPAPESPTTKTPDDKLGKTETEVDADFSASDVAIAMPMSDNDIETTHERVQQKQESAALLPQKSAMSKTPSPRLSAQFIPDQSPQPGKELTLFLQYKSKIKKFVMPDGYNELSVARLQLAFIEKFAWNTHSNGIDLPDIYIQDPVSGVRHELEDLNDVKDRCVLVLNVEPLDEVKRHFDEGLSTVRRAVENMQSAVYDQKSALQLVSDRQQDAAKEIAGIAATSTVGSIRGSGIIESPTFAKSERDDGGKHDATARAAQLSEVQSLRRDLAVIKQTYTSYASDIEASMASIRNKASKVKAKALDITAPSTGGDAGRTYVNDGKKKLTDDSEKIVNRVDDLQDLVEDLRKDVVTRGVRPLPRQLETVARDLGAATAELNRLKDFLKREKPVWTKIWEHELQVVCDDRDLLTMQEELAADLEDDLDKAAQTFALVEEATKQQQLQQHNGNANGINGGPGYSQNGSNGNAAAVGGLRSTSRGIAAVYAQDTAVDPRKAKDSVLGAVRALQPNHEARAEAIARAEKARQMELEQRRANEFAKELGSFVGEGKLRKTGGAMEVERLRAGKDEKMRKEVWERVKIRKEKEMERAREKEKAKERERPEAANGSIDAEAVDERTQTLKE